LLRQTPERTVDVLTAAKQADVDAGRATAVGQSITKPRRIAPVSLYFDNIVAGRNGALAEGIGRFNIELFLLHAASVPVERFTKAGMVAGRWAVSGVLPFAMLIPLSYLTAKRRVQQAVVVGSGRADDDQPDGEQLRIDRFYGRLKTPVAATPEQDHAEITLTNDDPCRFDHQKLLPSSNWEFTRWTRQDAIGFFGCCGIALAIFGILYFVLNIGG
jgi:hypothetical protein